jgi:hypothetical protein
MREMDVWVGMVGSSIAYRGEAQPWQSLRDPQGRLQCPQDPRGPLQGPQGHQALRGHLQALQGPQGHHPKSKCKTLIHGRQRASANSGLFQEACVRISCTLI